MTSEERLRLEESWIDAARITVWKNKSFEDNLQLSFARATKLDNSIEVIRQFTLLVERGITPPASILNALAIRFRSYLKIKPPDSLDAAFNLKRKQRVGHPLTHRLADEERLKEFFYHMWRIRQQLKKGNKKFSIEEAASQVILLYNLSISESVLQKKYSELKIDAIFEEALVTLALYSNKEK